MNVAEILALTDEQIGRMSAKEKSLIYGFLGERLVAKFFREQGGAVDVVMSTNEYDAEKDMTVDGKTVEVKTQIPWISESAYSIRRKQLPKCQGVDRLIIVDTNFGDILEVNPKTFKYREKATKGGLPMVLINMFQPAIKPIGKCTPLQLRIMRRFTVSNHPDLWTPVPNV